MNRTPGSERLVAWLRKYKVVFETLAATIFSITALLFSWQQTNISARQEAVARLTYMPRLEFRVALGGTGARWATADTLIVGNSGPLLTQLSVDHIECIRVTLTPSPHHSGAVRRFALRDYYDFARGRYSGTGDLLRLVSDDDPGSHYAAAKECALVERYLSAHLRDQECRVSIERLLRVDFADLLGQTHSERYAIEEDRMSQLSPRAYDGTRRGVRALRREWRPFKLFDASGDSAYFSPPDTVYQYCAQEIVNSFKRDTSKPLSRENRNWR